jgi:4'-phosphopantetheinyl transferase
VTELVRVWLVSIDVSPQDAARCRDVLDDQERIRADALRHERERQSFTIAHGALRILVGRALSARPADLTWIPGRHGKPELAPPWSGLHTSLSHSGGMVAAAISTQRPVGVDIQRVLPGSHAVGLSSRFFPPDEASYVGAGPDESVIADRFAQLWSRKEAVVKAVGGRLWPNLRMSVRDREIIGCVEPPNSLRVVDVAAPAHYRAAVALTGVAPFIVQAISWPSEDPSLAQPDAPGLRHTTGQKSGSL